MHIEGAFKSMLASARRSSNSQLAVDKSMYIVDSELARHTIDDLLTENNMRYTSSLNVNNLKLRAMSSSTNGIDDTLRALNSVVSNTKTSDGTHYDTFALLLVIIRHRRRQPSPSEILAVRS